MQKRNKILLAVVLFLFFGARAALAAPAPIYITQVKITGGAGKTEQDFVELFNPANKKVDLKGLRLVKRSASGSADSLIKSWDSDIYIPSQSFYLWANSSYTSISVKPDITTSATLSANNGVALRLGSENTGQLIDSLAWGKTNNGFKNVTAINPAAGLAIFRQNWYSTNSGYLIAASNPHNSLTVEATTEPAQSGQSLNTNAQSNPPAKVPVPSVTASPRVVNTQASSTEIVEGDMQPVSPSEVAYQNYSSPDNKKAGGNYLILAGGALLALLFLAWNYFFSRRK